MMHTDATLHYVADPMCSWCWGFAPQLERVRAGIPSGVELRYVMGGLAPDSDEPMAREMREYVQNAWREVAVRTGAEFNWEFWTRCEPRRSTYPACRAVLAAGLQEPEAVAGMFAAIQRAYYTEARNPSDVAVLVALAAELVPPLDRERFAADLVGDEVESRLQEGFGLRRSMGVRTFPSLVLARSGEYRVLLRGYGQADDVLSQLH